MRKIVLIISALAATILAGCIKNDIPYPYIQANFLTLSVEGQDGGSVIDSTAMTATVPLPEQVDITAVKIDGYTITPGAHVVGDPFAAPVNLSEPFDVTLELYQQYTWKIIGKQTIERYFEVEGQFGESVINVADRTVTVSMADYKPLDNLMIIRAKLGPDGSTSEPSLAEGTTFDGNSPLEIRLTAYGRTETWTVSVETVKVALHTLSVDAWTGVAWINGMGEAGQNNGAEYRLAGTEEWTKVPASDITVSGGNFTARINHLSPQTAYQARVYNDTMTGDIIDFTTGLTTQMPNSDFENWWQDGKVWCPWAEDGTSFWDTGNKGATTLGQSNSTPTTDTPSGSGWAAKLETRFVGLGPLGKLAAGNIFTGIYVRTEGTNGVLSFGRPFTERPVRLKGMFKYIGAPISNYTEGFASWVGRPDTCTIWIALVDCEQPMEIRTNPKNRQLFDPDAPEVIAYGRYQESQTVPEYIPFEVELKYKSTSRKPRYIICAASASKYGDYFTGGNGATLYVDDFELLYDY